MMTIFTRASNNQPISLGKQIASSGEGEVWETNLNGILAKIYHNPTPDRIDKLKEMLANPPVDPMRSQNHVSIAFPLDLLKNGSGAYVGFLMPAIRDSRELTTVYNPSLRKKKAPGFNWYYLHATALNTAWIIQAIHDKGYVLGDIKSQNILVNDRALVAVIDTDSFQVQDSHTGKVYRCTVGSEGFTPVELLGKDFSTTDQTEIHDRFRLAVLIHYLLFGYHPFSGEWIGSRESPEQTELIRKGFWYGGNNSSIRPSQNTIPLDVVHPEIKRCFLKCFNDGHTSPHLRPTAEDWHKALEVAINELTACDDVDSHHYSRNYGKCYWCERAAKVGVDIFPAVLSTSSTVVKTTTTPSAVTQTVPSSTRSSQTSGKSTSPPSNNSPVTVPSLPQVSAPSPITSAKNISQFKKILIKGILLVSGAALLLQVVGYVVGYRNKQIEIHHSNQFLIRTLTTSSGGHDIAISPNGETLVSGSSGGDIKIWDLSTSTLKKTLTTGLEDIKSLVISPDGQSLVISSKNDTIKIWDLNTATLKSTLTARWADSILITPDSQTLIIEYKDGINLWDLSTGTSRGNLTKDSTYVSSLQISPNGQTLFIGNVDGSIQVWDLSTRTLRGCLKSRQLSKKSSQGISCKYEHTAPLRAMSKAYSSNLTSDQWELLEPLIPAGKKGGRPRMVDIWQVINAIFYVLTQGCTWRNLPGDFPNWQTVYTYFRNWRQDGTWVSIHDHLRDWVRVDNEPAVSPTEAIIDSQSVKTAAMVNQDVGYDAGKKVKGRKRFLSVDTLGLVLRVLVSAANVDERNSGKQVLKKVKQMGNKVSRLNTIWVDAGYDGNPFMQWVMDFFRSVVQVVLRPHEHKGFVLLPKRWVVERTFGRLTGCRRLNKDYELLPHTSETFIYLAMIRIMVRRLAENLTSHHFSNTL